MDSSLNVKPCIKCGSTNIGYWTSTSTGKLRRYCRDCREKRAYTYIKRRKESGTTYTQKQWLEKVAQSDRCLRCGRRWEDIPRRPNPRYKNVWTKDHIIPLKYGGKDILENVRPLCYRCNSSKGMKIEKQKT